MTAYIEYVIADNMCVTAMICAVTYRVMKMSVVKPRVWAASLFGTAAAVCYPFLRFGAIPLLLVKAAVYKIICLILFFRKPSYLKCSAAFLAVTAAFGGAAFMTGYIFYGDVYSALTLPTTDFPIATILCAPIFTYFAAKKLIAGIIRRRHVRENIYRYELTAFGKTVKGEGFLDTGNVLYDDRRGLPIVVASASLTAKLLDDAQFEKMLLGRGGEIGDYIEYETANGRGKILTVKPQNFILYTDENTNILKEVALGLSLSPLGRKEGFDMLLSPAIF